MIGKIHIWATVAFIVVILALMGYLNIPLAFLSVVALSLIGIFILKTSSIVPMLQFALSLLILITLSGGPVQFTAAIAGALV